LILLHGRGRSGDSVLEPWRRLARSEGLILVAPDSLVSDRWDAVPDGPRFLIHLIEEVAAKHGIDRDRMYLFGHSAGANFALLMALLESDRFAAVAVHAGALGQEGLGPMSDASRKIPIHIQVGSRDQYYPMEAVQLTHDALDKRNFKVVLIEIDGHDHNYYRKSKQINTTAWAFLQRHALPAESGETVRGKPE
jgi:predicted esterase